MQLLWLLATNYILTAKETDIVQVCHCKYAIYRDAISWQPDCTIVPFCQAAISDDMPCISMVSVQMFAKSWSSPRSIMLLCLSSMQFPFYHNALVLLCNKNSNTVHIPAVDNTSIFILDDMN